MYVKYVCTCKIRSALNILHSVYANVGQQHNTNFDVDTFELCHNKAYLYHIVLTFNEIRKSVYFQCLKERDDYVCLF